ncbi:Cation channel sperm-associated protein 1 (CatSper1) [Durusdinium trenchii]|uniref:Cation channel sperm-associated protein 1 (CatSper1) n=1 Tax=Durusdinium trenchii TaxID=1381693 RepID=A0ABP0Q601_9DINO
MGSIGFSFRNITYRRPEEALFASDAVCMDSPEVLQPFFLCEPPEQVRLFITLFCVSVAFSLIINHPAAISYYRFVANANLPQSGRRGLGYNACKAYGIFPIGHLPESHFQMVGWLLVVSLLLACHSHLAPRFFLFASFGLYFLYFGQLFCESKHGGHGALLLPSVLLLLALSGGPLGSPWSLVFIKLFLGVIYFAGAVSKVVVAGVFGRPWLGSTMQAYIVDAMWSRPHSSSLVRALQCFIIQRWYLCTFLALSGLIFEFAWLPVVMFGGRLGSVLAGAVAFSFHLGVDLLQGLDFKPFWCPVFWVFLPDVQAIWHGQDVLPNEIWTILAQGFEEEPCRWIMSAAYLLLQVVVAIRFMDCWEGMECLPLTCCPMFAVPRNLFDDELRAGVMTDLDLRGGGHVDFAYNFFPWSTELPLSTTDLQHMPGRVLFWMSSLHCNENLTRMLKPEYLDKELLICANFDVSPALHAKLLELVQFLEQADPNDWTDAKKIGEVADLQAECRSLFKEHSFKKSQDACSYGLQATKGNPDLMNWMKFFTPTEWHPYVVFIVEILLRVMADGWTWFFATGNAVDVILIIVTGIIPTYILQGIFNVDSGELRIGQALRCVRLIRILKSVRTISAFRILWSLVSGIVDSGRILLWTLTIILVVLYMFSIFFVQLLVKSGLNLTPDQTDMVDGFMKTVPEAMFTLFQCLTLDSWTWFSRELQKDQPFVGVLWLLYVAVACMVLNNLVIAVIVNNAIARAEEDEELQASIARETTEGELNDLRQLFDELVPEADRDYMTQEEYEDAVEKQNETLWTKLKLNNLEEDEIMNLWTYMDWEEHIDREEFAQQIRNLKGECKAKHSYTVAMNLKKLDARLIQAKNYLETHKSLCEALKKETTQAQLELSRALHETRQFLLLTRRCIPGGQIPATASTQRRIEGFQGEVAKKVQPLLTPMMDLQEDTDETFRAQLVKMREQEGFSLPGEIDDSQAAQAFVPPMG